jgi:hypothetical protein
LNKTPVKRKITHVAREKRQQNFTAAVKFAVYTVIAVVVGLVGVGVHQWYKDDYQPMHEIVVNVNGTEFDLEYYIDMLKYVSGEYYQYASYFTSYALQYMENYELIKQEAEKLGITVTEQQITALIKEKEYDNTPAARDMVRASLLIPLLQEHFGSQIEPSTEQSYVLAMFLESETQVNDVKNRIANGESFTDIATELSLDTTTQKIAGDLGWLPEGVIDNILSNNILTSELISNAALGVLNSVEDTAKTKSVGYWILMVTGKETTTTTVTATTTTTTDTVEEKTVATIKAMLVGSQEEAEVVMGLLNDGADFDTVAKEHSQTWDEEDGSVLKVEKGDYSDVFDAFVFADDTQLDTLSDIIRDTSKSTTGGYWLYQVTDRAVQEISDKNMEYLVSDAMDAWMATFDYETVVVSENIDEMTAYAAKKVSGTSS